MAGGPLRIRIDGEGAEAEELLARARSGGLVLVEGEGPADLVARPESGIDGEGAAGGARPPLGYEPSRARSLSRRELEILEYLADGWSNAEIASVLGLKVRTVRFHLEGIYGKLGVSRRGEAVREAFRLGLLRFDF